MMTDINDRRIIPQLSLTVFSAFTLLMSIEFGYCEETLDVSLRYQQPTSESSPRFHRLTRNETWNPMESAVIVCDVWDSHHSVNAVRRVLELAPRIDQLVSKFRSLGATIIHAPSECMESYQDHPARARAQQVPQAEDTPPEIENWCDQIPSEQRAAYPLDQSDGGEDDDLEELDLWAQQLTVQGRKPRSPWLRQASAIRIDEKRDFISDSGVEIWNILQSSGISNVILVGVHTNMCVLGRPFGLRRMVSAGKNVVLVRDLTDTMYDPRSWPYASHFTGTDWIVDHIERYVCPTICSSQILDQPEFRFSEDRRPHLTMIIAEDEYQTEKTLPAFAAKHLSQHFRVSIAYGSENQRHKILSLDDIQHSDALLISVRRRWLPEADMQWIRRFVDSGRPMIGVRTASHAFSARTGIPPSGLVDWPQFDSQVWGGNYTGHHGNGLPVSLERTLDTPQHPIMEALGSRFSLQPGGSLYKVAPLAPGTRVLLMGKVADAAAEPVAWTYVRPDGGRSYYTSLGHPDDFAQPQFETLLAAGIHWACNQPLPDLDSVEQQNARYNAGQGRQR